MDLKLEEFDFKEKIPRFTELPVKNAVEDWENHET